jgi:hypothetical protein
VFTLSLFFLGLIFDSVTHWGRPFITRDGLIYDSVELWGLCIKMSTLAVNS